MTITVEIADTSASKDILDEVFAFFEYVDATFSTYKDTSEITRINKKELRPADYGEDMKTVLALSEQTKKETNGYFDIIAPDGTYDPSGLVKGWAIYRAAQLLEQRGMKHFYVNAGGDIQTRGKNNAGEKWSVGIKNPFNTKEIVKTVFLQNEGVATSGTYLRGQHIWNPKKRSEALTEIVSITVIGPNVYEADRFATAAFAMGKDGIGFIEKLSGFEGYQIDKNGMATMTSGFEEYTNAHA